MKMTVEVEVYSSKTGFRSSSIFQELSRFCQSAKAMILANIDEQKAAKAVSKVSVE
jgi:hypothetical protein